MRATLYALTLLLAGCAGPIETRIDSNGLTSVLPMGFASDAEIAGSAAQAQMLVSAALVEKGFRLAVPAELSLHVALSDRPSNLSLNAGSDILAPSAAKKRCAKREYRLGVTLTNIADGAIFYQAHASEYHCKLTVEQVLPFLVSAVTKDVGSPKGNYVVKRPRKSHLPTPPAASE